MREREREKESRYSERKKIKPKRKNQKGERLDDTKIDKDGKIKKKTLCLSSTKHPEVRHPCVCSYTHTHTRTRAHTHRLSHFRTPLGK